MGACGAAKRLVGSLSSPAHGRSDAGSARGSLRHLVCTAVALLTVVLEARINQARQLADLARMQHCDRPR